MQKLRAALGSVVFLLVAPGVVTGLGPWWITHWESTGPPLVVRVLGGLLVAVALVVLLHAFVSFVVEGLGTPAPVAPTEHLVVGGLYRFVRNPMYVAVVSVILGQALLLGRWSLVVYGLVIGLVQAAFVRLHEEPALLRRYGAGYADYRRGVPAWLPRPRPWSADRTPST